MTQQDYESNKENLETQWDYTEDLLSTQISITEDLPKDLQESSKLIEKSFQEIQHQIAMLKESMKQYIDIDIHELKYAPQLEACERVA